MHFSARSALIVSSCLALGVRALPVTYSVVDVDGGASATTALAGSGSDSGASSNGSADQPATVYHTVTKSTDVEEPEATTVSVSVTIVETKHAMPKPTNASSSSSFSLDSASSTPSPSEASAKAPSATSTPSSTDALSVLSSAQSTWMTRHTSSMPSQPAEPATNQSPSPSAAPHSKPADLGEDCDAANATVTASVPDVKETIVPSQAHSNGGTVTLLSTTTVVTDAAPTSYYDDGMWHTRYAIKPSAVPEKPEEASPKVNIVFEAAGKKQSAPESDEAEPKAEDVSGPAEKKQPEPQTNTTSQATNGTYHARRQVEPVAATPTFGEGAGTGAPQMLVHPIRPQPSGIAPHVEPNVVAARAAPTGDAAAAVEVLSARNDPTAAGIAQRAAPTGYSVVSWNETMQA